MAGKGKTWCLSSQPLVYVRTTLYVLIGPSLRPADWDDQGIPGKEANARAAWYCRGVGTTTYVTYSFHRVQTYDGRVGTAETYVNKKLSC